MLRIIAYDIAASKRLRRVARICEDFGVRVEKSVFECDLDEGKFGVFWKKLLNAFDPSEDYLVAYPVCRQCGQRVLSAGVTHRPDHSDVLVF